MKLQLLNHPSTSFDNVLVADQTRSVASIKWSREATKQDRALLLAAPELLAALIDMVQENQSELTAEHYAHARSAIAKAEGR